MKLFLPTTQEAYKLLHLGTLAFANAEQQGVRVDVEYIHQKQEELDGMIRDEMAKLRGTKFYREWRDSQDTSPNINSGPQLRDFLYKVKKYEPAKYTKTGKKEVKEKGHSMKGSVDEEALRELEIPALDIILRIRKLQKVRDTYLEQLLVEEVGGYVHPFFNLHTARTFRSSADKPNLQNIPKRDEEAMKIVRNAIYPRPGHQLLEIDYGALEVAIAACYHEDPTMLEYLHTGGDFHGDVCQQIFFLDKLNRSRDDEDYLRKATKNSFTFPQFYGDYYKNNAKDFCKWVQLSRKRWKTGQGIDFHGTSISDHFISCGIKSFDHLVKHIEDIEHDFWTNRFPVYRQWKDDWWEQYKVSGYVDMFTGFRCRGFMDKNDTINYPIQGSAFHCLLWSFIELDRLLYFQGWDTRLIGQIHDSLLLDAHPDEVNKLLPIIRRITCEDLPKQWPWIIVPLEIDAEIAPIDGSWADKEKIKF